MQSTDILLGKNTFQIWKAYWPKHAEMWAGINDVTKYVMSNSLDHSDWQNSAFLNHVDVVRKLKASEGAISRSIAVPICYRHFLNINWLMNFV